MENNDEIKTAKDLFDRINKAMQNKEVFTLNATFQGPDGNVQSVFFVSSNVQQKNVMAHLESFNSMLRAIKGQTIESTSLIRKTENEDFEQHQDGTFKLTIKR